LSVTMLYFHNLLYGCSYPVKLKIRVPPGNRSRFRPKNAVKVRKASDIERPMRRSLRLTILTERY
jgi:hypothetical protein